MFYQAWSIKVIVNSPHYFLLFLINPHLVTVHNTSRYWANIEPSMSSSWFVVKPIIYIHNYSSLTMAEILRETLRGFARAAVASWALSISHKQELRDTSSNWKGQTKKIENETCFLLFLLTWLFNECYGADWKLQQRI